MSRYYRMSLEVQGPKPEKIEAIKKAALAEWSFSNDDFTEKERDKYLTAIAEGNLCGGETEEQFALRLAKAIWKANGGFCRVTVEATCLEYIPSETYSFGPAAYDEHKD